MDDDGDDAPQKSRTQEPLGPAMGPVYLMWENSLEKLKILNYESGFCRKRGLKPFSRIQFVYPGKNPGTQSEEFYAICAWLFTEITRNSSTFKKDEYDDPNTAANKLLVALRQLDFKLAIPTQKIKTPHGEAICSILEFLTDKALENSNFKFGIPIYAEPEEIGQADVEDDIDDDEIVDDAVGDADDDAMFDDYAKTANDIGDTSLDNSSNQILTSYTDPIEWKTELERVGPKLRAQQQLSTNEWRSHVDQTTSSKGQIDKILVDTQSDLKGIERGVSDDLNRTRTKEKYISNQFSGLCIEYQEIKKQLELLEAKSGKSHERVASLNNIISELNEKLEDLKEACESKDSGVNDQSPLVRIKAALQQIKTEINSFDMRIGVVSHSLLCARVNQTNRKRIIAAQKARQRRGKNKKDSRLDDDDDSMISGDD